MRVFVSSAYDLLSFPLSSLLRYALSGSTPLPMFKKLVALHKAGKVSFKHVVTFNMDEWVGIPESHPESYHTYMHDHLFQVH